MLLALPVALAVAALIGWLLIRFEGLHAHMSHDQAASGPQKFHSRSTPRIGGIPVAGGLLAGLAASVLSGGIDMAFAAAFLVSVAPAFLSGLIEDVTKKLGPDMRLWASFLSALMATYCFDAVVGRSGIGFTDALLAWYPLALLFTMVGVGGIAHAVNIIDGYNGLASMVTVMMLAALGVVSWQLGDMQLTAVCLSLIGGTLGFFVWNFPHGRIFAGDGGAYLWGVTVGLVSVLLVHRHPTVSAWFPLAVVIYPVFETLFSVYRRKVKHAAAAGLPDARHLHQLIYRRLLSLRIPGVRPDADAQTLRNAATSPFLWALAAVAILPSALFWQDTSALIGLTLAFVIVYVWLYRAIVRFAVPRTLRRIGRRAARRCLAAQHRDAAEHQHPEHRPVLVGDRDRDGQ